MEIVASLNRYFEIIGLLYTYSHPDLDDKEVWNKAAKEYHISADELSRKMGSLPKKYFSAFQKAASVSNQEDFNFFFSDEDDAFVLLLQIVCATHPQWFSAPNPQITNEEVVIAFANLLCEDDKREIDAPPSDREIIEMFSKEYSKDYPEPDAIITLLKKGYSIKEVGVKMHERTGGKSSITPFKSLYYMIKVSLSILIINFSIKNGGNEECL